MKENVDVKGRGWEGNTFCLLLLERFNSEPREIRLNNKWYVSVNCVKQFKKKSHPNVGAQTNRRISLHLNGRTVMTHYSLSDGSLNLCGIW